MIPIVIIGGCILAAAAVLAAAWMLIGTGREKANIWQGKHAAGDRPRREMPARLPGGDLPSARRLPDPPAGNPAGNSATWGFRPMDALPATEKERLKADFIAAVERGKGKPLTVLPPFPPQADTGPLSPRRERLIPIPFTGDVPPSPALDRAALVLAESAVDRARDLLGTELPDWAAGPLKHHDVDSAIDSIVGGIPAVPG